MFTTGISNQTQSNLELLKNVPFVSKYYLAGGTALSLHFGHRISNDLDFFSPTPEDPRNIVLQLQSLGKLEVDNNSQGTFNGLLNSNKLSFFLYPYKLLSPLVEFNGIKVASVVDTGCMKLDAISSRGTKRDFIDIYFICNQSMSLQELLEKFQQKYTAVNYNLTHILKSLVYFEDAEKGETPQMLKDVKWEDVKRFFEKEVRNLKP